MTANRSAFRPLPLSPVPYPLHHPGPSAPRKIVLPSVAAGGAQSDTDIVNTDEYRERLAHDIAGWQRAGLISREQERAILARMGAGEPRLIGALRMGWLITAVSIIGAVVLALGVILFFATSWETMPDAFRAGLLISGVLASYAIAWVLMERYEIQRIGSAFLLLGALLYVAALFLLAQIYDLPVDSPQLWLLGAIGVAPLAYLFASRIVLLLTIATATAWVIAEMVNRYPDSPEMEASLIVIGAFGVAVYAVGRLHTLKPQLSRFADVYAFAGLLLVLGLMYVFGFRAIWDEVVDSGVEAYAAPTPVYVFIGIAAVLVAAQRLLRARTVEADIESAAQAALLVLAAVVGTWPDWSGYVFVFNAAYFGLAAALVAKGYLQGDERYINFGLAVVAIGLVTRYIDLLWPMLDSEGPAAAFFMVGGVLLLALAFGLERLRRALIKGMQEPPPAGVLP